MGKRVDDTWLSVGDAVEEPGGKGTLRKRRNRRRPQPIISAPRLDPGRRELPPDFINEDAMRRFSYSFVRAPEI